MAMVMKVEASSLALMQLLSGNSHNIEGYNCDTSNHSPFSALTARETCTSAPRMAPKAESGLLPPVNKTLAICLTTHIVSYTVGLMLCWYTPRVGHITI